MLAAFILVALNGYRGHKKRESTFKIMKIQRNQCFHMKTLVVCTLLYLFEMHYDATFLNHGVFLVMIHEVG